MEELEPKHCTLRVAARGEIELCPKDRCAFWESGGAVLQGGCLVERLGIDVHDKELAEYLLETRERVEGTPDSDAPEAVEKGGVMKPIMFATDGSPTAEKATETAIELAKALGTELVVVTVWEIPYTTVGLAPAPVVADLAKLSEDDARTVVTNAAARAEEAGVESRTVVLRGITVQEICDAAAKLDPRFIVVGSHGWGVVRRTLFGSVSTGVLHHAKCPVLVIRADDAAARANGKAEHAYAAR